MRSEGDYYQLVADMVVHEELRSLTWQPGGDTSVSAQPAVRFIWRAAADERDYVK